jgi:6-phosphofructokinase 1
MDSKKFAILTSGGDSPGMNCAIRAFTRAIIYSGHKVIGIERGYTGLLAKDFRSLKVSSVGNILQLGGTILQSSRCPEFHEEKFRELAAEHLKEENIDGLVVIGGDGSFNGAYKLFSEQGVKVIGIPGTIDNDISGTEYTIGHDTAVQTAIEAVDKIRDTAFSHDRVFLIEVMGRNSSALAQKVGVCSGAENVILPFEEIDYEKIAAKISQGVKRGKKGSILIVAEGKTAGRSYDIAATLESKFKLKSKVCILGHIQRGGAPSAQDRLIASTMGAKAAQAIVNFEGPKVTVVKDGKVQLSDFKNCLQKVTGHDLELETITKVLSI